VISIAYEYEFLYSQDEDGKLRPRLTLSVSNTAVTDSSLDIDAYLDTGAEVSLFNGSICQVIGINLLDGEPLHFRSTNSASVEARLHEVRLAHPDLGVFSLTLGFTIQQITRNLLGRDFFDLIQIGFREHHAKFFVALEDH